MKKLVLSLACAATMLPLSAKTVTFVGETSVYNAKPDEEIVVIPMNWTGQTIYCNAMNLYIGGGTRSCAYGGLCINNSGNATTQVAKSTGNAYFQFVPVEGVTIKKISITEFGVKCPILEMEGDPGTTATAATVSWTGEVVGTAELNKSKKFYLNYVENIVDGVDQTDHKKEGCRVNAISVEYDGEPNRSKMPTDNLGNEYISNTPIVLTNNEPGAKLMYSISNAAGYDVYTPDASKDTEFTEYDGTPLVLTQPTKISCYAIKDGQRKSALYYKWVIPGPEETHHAVFNLMDPAGMGADMARATAGATGSTLRCTWMQYKNNGVIFTPSSNVTTNNAARLMSTEAYGYVWQMRFNSGNKDSKEQNRLNFETENPENAICAVVLKGSTVKGLFEPSQKEQTVERDENGNPIDADGNRIIWTGNETVSSAFVKKSSAYVFPDNVNYDDATAPNYKTKMLPTVSIGNYVVMWKQSEDYEGDPSSKVIFEYNGADIAVLHQLHVFYRGEAPSAVKGIQSDENAPISYYNLQGVKISNPTKGQLIIKRQGTKTTKVIF